jgi:hypothetical protein
VRAHSHPGATHNTPTLTLPRTYKNNIVLGWMVGLGFSYCPELSARPKSVLGPCPTGPALQGQLRFSLPGSFGLSRR